MARMSIGIHRGNKNRVTHTERMITGIHGEYEYRDIWKEYIERMSIGIYGENKKRDTRTERMSTGIHGENENRDRRGE